jgi:Fe-S oxidoreductase
VTVAELERWQELIYDSCTMCGRCTMICPMGIDIAGLVGLARHGMFKAGLVPHELWAVAERAEREGSPLGATPKVLKERLEWLADEHEVPMRLDQPEAEVLVTFSSIEIMKYPQSLVATARVLAQLAQNRGSAVARSIA